MRVLQINAVYGKFSTGRLTKELHLRLQEQGAQSYVASCNTNGLLDNSYRIGSFFDWKLHALLSRITGLQGYFSKRVTKKLTRYMDRIAPDIVHLGNLHNNYINLPMLLRYLSDHHIATVLTLHDSWFYTGKCMYYIEVNCDKWKSACGTCPALKLGNKSYFFDRTKKMLADKQAWFSCIDHLAVIGVSQWVTEDARQSILKNASIIQCIYNWVDLQVFRPRDPSALRKSMGLEGQFVILGIAMQWIPVKGIHIFSDLAKTLPENCKIVLAGHCDDHYKSDNILYLGNIDDVERLAELYSMADVFVNPTIQETFGMTTAEAMASGTPVVAYHSTATPELLGDDSTCGILVEEYASPAFQSAILAVRETGKQAYTAPCRLRAETLFNKEQNIQRYMDIYHALQSMSDMETSAYENQ